MIDKEELSKIQNNLCITKSFGRELDPDIPGQYCKDIWTLINLANRVLSGELVEAMSEEELHSIIFNFDIKKYFFDDGFGAIRLNKLDYSRGLAQAIHDRLKGVTNEKVVS